METPRVRDIMIPVSEYVVIEDTGVLSDAFVALEDFCRDKNKRKPHRDVLVTRDGKVVAKLTMLDVLKALEPRYEHIQPERYQGRTLTAGLVDKLIREFGLWADPTAALCRKAGSYKIADVMHLPEAAELLDEDDTVEHALHRYILGVHQPLLVQRDGEVTGVLRLGDVFDYLKTKITECPAG
ncbi:CBS domain-containing protein [Oleidesulfovibrio sp.]|uniref:CBS domain-containing protein n=1 Tax=Oleidesulfovibrio sp. TaxID=2909707 RepID=UPI003A8C0FDD